MQRVGILGQLGNNRDMQLMIKLKVSFVQVTITVGFQIADFVGVTMYVSF